MSFKVAITILLVLFIVGIITFILLYHKPTKDTFGITAKQTGCYLDSDCLLQYDSQGNAYTSLCAIQGKATSGVCSPYCITDNDCWYGRTQGSTQCITEFGRSVCRVKACTSAADCTSDETCTPIPNQKTTYCLKVAYTPGSTVPLPCQSGKTCFGSDMPCTTPFPSVSINCCTNSNCPTGMTCTNTSQACGDSQNCGGSCGTCVASQIIAGYCTEYSSVSDCPSGNGAYGKCQ